MQTSTNNLAKILYPPEPKLVEAPNTKTLKSSRPTTAGNKIRSQASRLVAQLIKCTPHYIRCIKPNETKKSRDWDSLRVKHQVEYLGLKENIRVRRAGFAYRRVFAKFLHRYAILTKETWPIWNGNQKRGIQWIMSSLHIDENQYQLGTTKVFIKAPETLFMLEEARDRKYNFYARIIQKSFKKYFARKRQDAEKQAATDLLFGHKQRRRASLERNFVGDYIGLSFRPGITKLFGRRDKVFFAEIVKKYDRRFKMCRRDLIITGNCLYLIGRADKSIKKGPIRQRISEEIIKRKLTFDQISHVSMSTLQDDFVIIHVKEDYASLLQIIFKTEFLSVLSKKYSEELGHTLNIKFSNSLEFKVKKEGWGGGGTRQVKFSQIGYGDEEGLKASGKVLNVTIGPGMPSSSRPTRSTNCTSVKNQKNSLQSLRPAPGSSSNRLYTNADVLRNHNRPGKLPMATPRDAPHHGNRSNVLLIGDSHRNNNNGQISGLKTKLNKVLSNHPGPRFGIPPPPSDPAPPNQPVIQHPALALQTHLNKLRPPPPPPVANCPRVKALYDYNPQDLDELRLKEGDLVELLKEDEGGWWHGRLRGKTGLFPANYVEKI